MLILGVDFMNETLLIIIFIFIAVILGMQLYNLLAPKDSKKDSEENKFENENSLQSCLKNVNIAASIFSIQLNLNK